MTYRVIYAGTPEFSVPALAALLQMPQVEVIAVYSQPDRPAGRGRKLTASPVKSFALDNNIPVYQPLNLKNEEEQKKLRALNADLMVVTAYGLILPEIVLKAPKFGCINIHASLLPRWRGAAPIQRAILEGDQSTGITIMQMDIGLDTGDMLHKKETTISPSTTSAELHNELMELGAQALTEALPKIFDGTIKAVKQNDDLANYAKKLEKSEAELNWQLDANSIVRKINGYNPWPVAYSPLGNSNVRFWRAKLHKSDEKEQFKPGQVIDISSSGLVVACGQGSIQITEIQLPNKRKMSISDAINGFDFKEIIFGQ